MILLNFELFSGTSAVGGWCRESLMWGQGARYFIHLIHIWGPGILYLYIYEASGVPVCIFVRMTKSSQWTQVIESIT